MSFKVGDFVSIGDEGGGLRIVANPKKDYGNYFGIEVETIVLSRKYFIPKSGETTHVKESYYEKIEPTKELVNMAKIEVKATYERKKIDNLTFIEISARLREYEQQF